VDHNIIELTDQNYRSVVAQHPLVFVDCWAEWCQPCLALNPLFDALANEFAGRIKIAKLNVVENEYLIKEYELNGLPAFLVFKDGEFLSKYPYMIFSMNPDVLIRKAMNDLVEE
jgi:thioredoxin 1